MFYGMFWAMVLFTTFLSLMSIVIAASEKTFLFGDDAKFGFKRGTLKSKADPLAIRNRYPFPIDDISENMKASKDFQKAIEDKQLDVAMPIFKYKLSFDLKYQALSSLSPWNNRFIHLLSKSMLEECILQGFRLKKSPQIITLLIGFLAERLKKPYELEAKLSKYLTDLPTWLWLIDNRHRLPDISFDKLIYNDPVGLLHALKNYDGIKGDEKLEFLASCANYNLERILKVAFVTFCKSILVVPTNSSFCPCLSFRFSSQMVEGKNDNEVKVVVKAHDLGLLGQFVLLAERHVPRAFDVILCDQCVTLQDIPYDAFITVSIQARLSLLDVMPLRNYSDNAVLIEQIILNNANLKQDTLQTTLIHKLFTTFQSGNYAEILANKALWKKISVVALIQSFSYFFNGEKSMHEFVQIAFRIFKLVPIERFYLARNYIMNRLIKYHPLAFDSCQGVLEFWAVCAHKILLKMTPLLEDLCELVTSYLLTHNEPTGSGLKDE